MGNAQQTPKDEKKVQPKVQPKVGKSGKKICCSCPDTKTLRDGCTLENGPESDLCKELIEKHKECLRGEGFIVK
jgi:cytochrome c oxidase assembly protein subunit 17